MKSNFDDVVVLSEVVDVLDKVFLKQGEPQQLNVQVDFTVIVEICQCTDVNYFSVGDDVVRLQDVLGL